MVESEPSDSIHKNETPMEFVREHKDILENLAKHGSPIEQAMAKAYMELYGDSSG
ncbi:hypothetical protein MettiDRAFT_0748 [Methanolobus tindarius DSM 2278]|uniref:Uncharacterized protein n=1 Tax=Methanolobus tindarius DSM 2278 TaxID=1090322 RepID=W9DPU2_METTI|nr:hypothetical protein MettiDRAFT_0748 [Methanolobus tindarius DSM 2278]